MKTIHIVLLSILFVIFLVYLIINNIADGIDFDFNIKGININSFGIAGGLATSANVELILINNSRFNFNLQNIYFELYYKGKRVLYTDKEIDEIILKRNTTVKKDVLINIRPDQYTGEFVSAVRSGKKTQIEYLVKLRLFGIRIKHKGDYILNEN
jgi:hypothetical protein